LVFRPSGLLTLVITLSSVTTSYIPPVDISV
jgi:hypothetical protein